MSELSEEQQVEELKKWWAQNGKSVVMALIIGVAAFIGARYYLGDQAAKAEQASALYDAVIEAVEQENHAAAVEKGSALIGQFSGTPYANLGALALAKVKYEQNELQAAQAFLQGVVDKADDSALAHIARQRLVRVLWAQNNTQQAFDLIKDINDAEFAASYAELRGDLLVALNRAGEARTNYQAALNDPKFAGDRNTLEMKLHGLGTTTSP